MQHAATHVSIIHTDVTFVKKNLPDCRVSLDMSLVFRKVFFENFFDVLHDEGLVDDVGAAGFHRGVPEVLAVSGYGDDRDL